MGIYGFKSARTHRIIFEQGISYANITEANALQIDWKSVVLKEKLSYIMENPHFVGYFLQSKEQKSGMLSIYVDEKCKPYKIAGKIDYIAD